MKTHLIRMSVIVGLLAAPLGVRAENPNLPTEAAELVTKLAELEAEQKASYESEVKRLRELALGRLREIASAQSTGTAAHAATTNEIRRLEELVGIESLTAAAPAEAPTLEEVTYRTIANMDFMEAMLYVQFTLPGGARTYVFKQNGEYHVCYKYQIQPAVIYPIIKVEDHNETFTYQRPQDAGENGMTIYFEDWGRRDISARVKFPGGNGPGQELQIEFVRQANKPPAPSP